MAATKELTARQRLDEWIEQRIAGNDEVPIPTLRDAAITAFKNDGKFLAQLGREYLAETVYEAIRRCIGRSRLVVLGDVAATKDAVTERAAKLASRWDGWWEHSGERHVQLLEMTRDDLLAAAEERERRGRHELFLARLWRHLAERLENGDRVRDQFTADQIDQAAAELRKDED